MTCGLTDRGEAFRAASASGIGSYRCWLAVGSRHRPSEPNFLRQLARRGKLVISDAHEGIKAAVAKVLHATWQRCRGNYRAFER